MRIRARDKESIVLDGNKVWLHTNNRDLHIQDQHTQDLENWKLKPSDEIDSITIVSDKGSISISAIHFCSANGIQINILDYQGNLVSGILPQRKTPVYRVAQYKAYEDTQKRLYIAQKLIEAKISGKIKLLDWLGVKEKMRFSNINISNINSIGKLCKLEQDFGVIYWDILKTIFPKELGFEAREGIRKSRGEAYRAMDGINCLLNYGYSILASYCLKAINSAGLDASVGYLHEYIKTAKNLPLVYDLQEPFRYIVELVIIKALKENQFTIDDFEKSKGYKYRYSWNLRIKKEATKKLIEMIQRQFSSRIDYGNNRIKLSTAMLQKTKELRYYLVGYRKELDFTIPYELREKDDQELRTLILDLEPHQAKLYFGVPRNMLRTLTRKARSDESFKLNRREEFTVEGLKEAKEQFRITTTRTKR